uniref:Sushi domain-containing protein n=1 Tax=Varanus komodoensis TaxID=61221 RepID=A0A8D2KYF7_VARKO
MHCLFVCLSVASYQLIPMVLSAYCSSPPRVDHGKYSALESAKYTNGASVKYSCESGYVLIGEATIYCTASGAWSIPVPHCKAMRCPFPPKILHGKYIERDFRYGQSIRYKCDTGYSLVGEELVTCILAGSNAVKWSETPKCKVVQCKLPPSIENGAHSNQGTAVFTRGMSVQYTCKPGYTLTGEANLYCSDSGTWSPLPPHCEVTGCVTPDVQNGKVTLSEEEGRITIRCNPGYFLKGNHTIQCTLDRMWDSPPPTCVRGMYSCNAGCFLNLCDRVWVRLGRIKYSTTAVMVDGSSGGRPGHRRHFEGRRAPPPCPAPPGNWPAGRDFETPAL